MQVSVKFLKPWLLLADWIHSLYNEIHLVQYKFMAHRTTKPLTEQGSCKLQTPPLVLPPGELLLVHILLVLPHM